MCQVRGRRAQRRLCRISLSCLHHGRLRATDDVNILYAFRDSSPARPETHVISMFQRTVLTPSARPPRRRSLIRAAIGGPHVHVHQFD